MDTTENPSFAAAPDTQPSGGRADLEAAVALLNVKDGYEAETVETLESLMIAREAELRAEFAAKLDALKDELEAAAPLSAAVRSAVAHLTEAPLNFHQATVMYAADRSSDDGEMAGSALLRRRRAGWSLVLSVLMVLMQCMVTMGVVVGTLPGVREQRPGSQKGTYCASASTGAYCADVPLPQ